MTLKEQFERSRAKLGATKSDAVIAALEIKLGRVPTLKQKVEVLEREASGPARIAPQPAAGSSRSNMTAVELIRQYDDLTSDEQRRAFYNRHTRAISEFPGSLAQICMYAAKPLSPRARAEIQVDMTNAEADRQAVELIEKYRTLDSPARSTFWRQGENREVLEKSRFAEGSLLFVIAAGKPLTGHALATYGIMKEQQ